MGRMRPQPAKDAGMGDILGGLLEIGGYAQAKLGDETVSAAAAGRAEAQGGCQKWNEEYGQTVGQVDRPGEAEDNGN